MLLPTLLVLCATAQAWRLRTDTDGLHDRQTLQRPFHMHGGLLARPHGYVHRPLHVIHDALRAQARVYNAEDPSVSRVIDVPDCGKCPPGFGVLHDCRMTGARAQTVCHACPAGDFSSDEPSHELCRPCSQCGQNLYEEQKCTATSDTVCASCAEIRAPINADYMRKCWKLGHADEPAAQLEEDSDEDEAFYKWEDNDWQPDVSRQVQDHFETDSESDEDRWAKALDRADADELDDMIDYAGYEYSDEDEYLSSEDIDGFVTERRGDERVHEMLDTDYEPDEAFAEHVDDEYFFPSDFAEDMSAAEVDDLAELAEDDRYTWGEARPFFRAASRTKAQFEAEREEAKRIHYRPTSYEKPSLGHDALSARVRNCLRRLMRHTRALGVALLALTASLMLATVLCWCRACRARRSRRHYGAVGVRNRMLVATQSLPRVHRRSPNDGSTVPYEKLNDVEREAIARSAAHIDAEEAVRGWPRRGEDDALLQQQANTGVTVAECSANEESDAPRPEVV